MIYAQRYGWIIAHDAPYTDICFDNFVAPSILQIPGAKEIAVEFNSLSKIYNMAGWRLGMAVGNSQIVSYLNTYKSQMDLSQFGPVLAAGVKALTSDQTWIKARNQIYKTRRDIVIESLKKGNFKANCPLAAIYVWVDLPDREDDSVEYCLRMLNDTGVSTTPGVVYGKYGEGHFRISLGIATEKLSEAMCRILEWSKDRK